VISLRRRTSSTSDSSGPRARSLVALARHGLKQHRLGKPLGEETELLASRIGPLRNPAEKRSFYTSSRYHFEGNAQRMAHREKPARENESVGFASALDYRGMKRATTAHDGEEG